jgi:hypothetical protein
MPLGGGRSGSVAHSLFNGPTHRIELEENAPMSRSSEFVHLALLSAIFIGVAMLSRFF